jgi:hypothetical protein
VGIVRAYVNGTRVFITDRSHYLLKKYILLCTVGFPPRRIGWSILPRFSHLFLKKISWHEKETQRQLTAVRRSRIISFSGAGAKSKFFSFVLYYLRDREPELKSKLYHLAFQEPESEPHPNDAAPEHWLWLTIYLLRLKVLWNSLFKLVDFEQTRWEIIPLR